MNKTAIVIGATGMDGESAIYFLLSKGYNVVGTYRKNTHIDLDALALQYGGKMTLEYCEITDFTSVKTLLETCLKRYGTIDEIYLLAAQSQVFYSFLEPAQTVLCNGMSAFNFLENLRLLSPSTRLYYAATSELFGGDPSRCPFHEESEYECRSPYSIGKELGTRWIKYYVQTHGMYACYGVLFNHSNTSRGKNFFIRRVTSSAARICLGLQSDLILGNLAFSRDEHWSDFGIEMMWAMLQRDKPETYVICRGRATQGEEFLDASFDYFNLDWRKFVKTDKALFRPNEVVKLTGDPSKAIRDLGWRPDRMPFKDHIALMCAYDYDLERGEKPIRPDVFKLYP